MTRHDGLALCIADWAFLESSGQRVHRPECFTASHLKFGSVSACIRTNDAEFSTRFLRIFSDCLEPPGLARNALKTTLEVDTSCASEWVHVDISRHAEFLDPHALPLIFPELQRTSLVRDFTEDWQLFCRKLYPGRPVVAMRGNQLLLRRELPWQMIVAHYFLNHVMRLQPEMFFLHGATMEMGNRGVLLSGSKGAGKSTLSLALAARGHGFLGDEIATIDGRTGLVLPFRRAVSIRPGPQANAVTRFLDENHVDHETLPDGTTRSRALISSMFPGIVPTPTPLTHTFFLNGIAETPKATEFSFSLKHLPLLSPLHATLASVPAGERTVAFLKLFSNLRCYILVPGGTPEQTAELIENIVEGNWDTAYKKRQSVSAHFAG